MRGVSDIEWSGTVPSAYIEMLSTIIEEEATEELPSLLVDDIIPLQLLTERLTKEIVIAIDADAHGKGSLDRTEALLKEHNGNCPIRFVIQTPNEVLLTVITGDNWQVHPSLSLLDDLVQIWGKDHVQTVHT